MSPEGAAGPKEKIRFALWTHQIVEYLLAALILTQSINGGDAAPFIAVAGGLLFVLAAVTAAPVSIAHWISPRVHRVLDFVVIAALVLAPIVSGSTDVLAWALCFLAAGALAWLNWHTQWTRPARRSAPAAPGPSKPAAAPKPDAPKPAAPTSRAASAGDSARALGAKVDRTTRGASRAAGRLYGRARARRPTGDEKPEPDA